MPAAHMTVLLAGTGVDITREIPAPYLARFALVMLLVLIAAHRIVSSLFLPKDADSREIPFMRGKGRKAPRWLEKTVRSWKRDDEE